MSFQHFVYWKEYPQRQYSADSTYNCWFGPTAR